MPSLREIRLENIVSKHQEPEKHTLERGEMSLIQQRQVWGHSEILNRPQRLRLPPPPARKYQVQRLTELLHTQQQWDDSELLKEHHPALLCF